MKRFCAFALCAALLTSMAAGPVQAVSSWVEDPDEMVTRGMAAQLLYEAAGSPEGRSTQSFKDVSGPQADAISWAADNGYINGVGDGLYRPDALVTRQEFSAILYRQAGSPAVSGRDLEAFSDYGTVGNWAEDALLWSVKAGLISGKLGGRLAPTDTITMAEATTILRRAQSLPDVEQIRADLEKLTSAPRPVGSEGERAAVKYLEERFREMGYTVTLQPYTAADGKTGTNVIAVREAKKADADIFVLSAHHDSVPTAYGANDDASGVAALLAAAEALKDVQTDTELRFISFTDEENGKNGSRYYTSTLSSEEKERMVGDIQFDMLGGLGTSGMAVCTADGEANWVSDLLRQECPALELDAETASDHTAFQLAGVPAVLLMQDGQGYLYHSAADTVDQLDLWAIAGAVRTVIAAVEEIASDRTESYREVARTQGGDHTYCQTRQNVIYFGMSRSDTEAYVGASGELADHWEVEGPGWTDRYEAYRYSMRWFGGEEPMATYYQYRNGFLDHIEIRPCESGYTTERVRSLMTLMYGAPDSRQVSAEGVVEESWADEVYGKYLTLTDDPAGATVTVSGYSMGLTNVLSSYPVAGGQASISDPEDAKVWEYLCSILPLEYRQKIAQFALFTDGVSNVLAYTSPVQEEGSTDNTRFVLSIDYYDVYDENGAPRDWSKLTYTILHEYGHVLLEDETQIDLSVGKGTHDPAGFIEGSFRKRFYDTFWADLGDSAVSDYEKDPTRYVSRYGANYFHEDIADTFAVFVLGDKPQGETVAEQKLLFFWNDPGMMELRQAVRQSLGLEPVEEGEKDGPLAVTSTAEIQRALSAAIAALEQPAPFDVSALGPQEDLEMTVRNLYHAVIGEHPEYKYAYDIQISLGEDGLLRCTLSYMPYRTGEWPAGHQGAEVDGLGDLMRVAQAGLDQEIVPIRITDTALSVDDMNKALQQVGGSYFLCQLNRDGTAIEIRPLDGLSHAQALERLEEIDALAEKIYGACVTPGMDEEAAAKALYTYLTEHVRYDRRYYSDPASMPYESMTALGALRDDLAICGGYAQALQVLFQRAGIPCLTVSGEMGGEGHMWDLAYLGGEWHWFDATSDRDMAGFGFRHFNVGDGQMEGYTWDQDHVRRLAQDPTILHE